MPAQRQPPMMSYVQGVLARVAQLLLCRWSCPQCWSRCWSRCWAALCSCLEPSHDQEEVQILGPFPAPTPPWLLEERDGDAEAMVVSAHGPPARDGPAKTPRVSSSYSLAGRRVSSLESYRRSSSSTPDSPGSRAAVALPPDLWSHLGPGRAEPVQPVLPAPPVQRGAPPPSPTSRRDTRSCSVRLAEQPSNIEPRLYRADSGASNASSASAAATAGGANDDTDSLTDEEVLSRYQLGALHFSAQYDLPHGRLLVRVIEARELPRPSTRTRQRSDTGSSSSAGSDGGGAGAGGGGAGSSLRHRESTSLHSNPYVKLCLLPDQKNSRQTGVRRKTQDPLFEERYSFELPFLEAQRRTLMLTVLDFDKFSRHCIVGKVAMPLAEVDLIKGGHWWKPIVPSSQSEVELGELLVSLNYLPSAGRLNVEIVRAKQLLQTDMAQGSDPFVRVQLVHALKVVKSKRTACIHGTVDPCYNESFSFHVTPDLLDDVSLVLTVFGRSARTNSELIGRVVLGRFPSGAPELTHWRRAMASPRTPVAQWHSLRSRGACDRVSPASLAVT